MGLNDLVKAKRLRYNRRQPAFAQSFFHKVARPFESLTVVNNFKYEIAAHHETFHGGWAERKHRVLRLSAEIAVQNQPAAGRHRGGKRRNDRASNRIEGHLRPFSFRHVQDFRFQTLLLRHDDMSCSKFSQLRFFGGSSCDRNRYCANVVGDLYGRDPHAAGSSGDNHRVARANPGNIDQRPVRGQILHPDGCRFLRSQSRRSGKQS